MNHARLLGLTVFVGVVALTGCPQPPQVIDTPVLTACEDDAQCSTGTLCVAGECRLAQCNPGVEAVCGIDNSGPDRPASCCKSFENCNVVSLVCERDPAAVGIGCPPGEDTTLFDAGALGPAPLEDAPTEGESAVADEPAATTPP